MSEITQLASVAGMFFSVILFVVCFKMYKNQNKKTTIIDRKKARMKRKRKKARLKYGKIRIFINIKNNIILWLKSLRKY